MKTRLQQVAWEFIVADEALRKALLRAERSDSTIKSMQRLCGPKQPRRVWIVNEQGHRELHSLPIDFL